MPRFVVLYHEVAAGAATAAAPSRGSHWDLMLEPPSLPADHTPETRALWTWAISERPDLAGALPAERLPYHRLQYLEYEGPISGGRGQVSRWDTGDYQLLQFGPDRCVVQLTGQRLRGRFTLRTEPGPAGWLFERA